MEIERESSLSESEISIEQKPSNAKNKILLEPTSNHYTPISWYHKSYEKFLVPLFPKSGDESKYKSK
jgi:hypothetical protein